MPTSIGFLLWRALYRVFDFIRDWYIGGAKTIFGGTIRVLESLDKSLALAVTLRYFFKPLYQDYSVIGYSLGIVFRFLRILIACILYALIAVAGIVIYVAWAALLPFIIYRGFFNTV